MKINMHEAKSKLSKLGEMVWNGEKVVIAKSGKPYLDLLPHQETRKTRKPGRFKDQIRIPEDFNDQDDEIIQAFEGSE